MIDRRAAFLEWLRSAQLPLSEPYECPYLPGRIARQRGIGAEHLDSPTHQLFMDTGFRRAGTWLYQMACPSCKQCVPLRVPVASFQPSRSQRRTLRRNEDVRLEVARPDLRPDAAALYRAYLSDQHPHSDQESSDESLFEWLYRDVTESLEARYYLEDELIGVSILDFGDTCLSAVYHFFAPKHRKRRIGVLSVLREIQQAAQLGLEHYYLGFWISSAPTMAYKSDYGPHELLRDDLWMTPTADRNAR
ncbi:MAG: arginyltransferase [Planctomycetota bacterium]